MISPEQCRAARGLLGWTQQDLADRADIGIVTVCTFENGRSNVYRTTIRMLSLAFAEAGIELIPEDGGGEGVRFRRPRAERG